MVTTHTDTSEHQQHGDGSPILIDDTYSRPFAMFRVASEHGRVDAAIGGQIHRALDLRVRGRLANFGGYVIPCVITNALNLQRLNEVRFPTDAVVMIDLESWPQPDGTALVSGDHSGQLNDLADALRARQGGRPDLVWGYGNRGDLNALWPHRPSWLGFIVASYGPTKPSWLPQMVGWQYTNGQTASGTRPTSTAPYGHCDHNELYIPIPTPGGTDMALDADTKKYFDTAFADLQDRLNLNRLTKIDETRSAVGNIQSAVAAIRPEVGTIAAKVGALSAGGTVDVAALADALKDELGAEVAAELAKRLAS